MRRSRTPPVVLPPSPEDALTPGAKYRQQRANRRKRAGRADSIDDLVGRQQRSFWREYRTSLLMALLFVVGFVPLAMTVSADEAIRRVAVGRIGPVTAVGPAQVAIILGARADGVTTPSPLLAARLDTGLELLRRGRVFKLLLTGNGQSSVEPEAMRRYVIDRGVPPEDVFVDPDGLSTFRSLDRARAIYGVRTAVVVSERSHVERAVYLADRLGIVAWGAASQNASTGRPNVRERLARVKAIFTGAVANRDVVAEPPIPITGDGRRSWPSSVDPIAAP